MKGKPTFLERFEQLEDLGRKPVAKCWRQLEYGKITFVEGMLFAIFLLGIVAVGLLLLFAASSGWHVSWLYLLIPLGCMAILIMTRRIAVYCYSRFYDNSVLISDIVLDERKRGLLAPD